MALWSCDRDKRGESPALTDVCSFPSSSCTLPLCACSPADRPGGRGRGRVSPVWPGLCRCEKRLSVCVRRICVCVGVRTPEWLYVRSVPVYVCKGVCERERDGGPMCRAGQHRIGLVRGEMRLKYWLWYCITCLPILFPTSISRLGLPSPINLAVSHCVECNSCLWFI